MNAHITGLVTAVFLAVPAAGQSMDWCTYLGGSAEDRPEVSNCVLVDAQGRTYVVGRTYSAGFPTTPGAFDQHLDGDRDGFVARLSRDGATLEWATFHGGSDLDAATAATIDGQGRIIVVGGTRSENFPVTEGAYDTTHDPNVGAADVFIAILDPDVQGDPADQLVYSTFLGGPGVDAALDVFYDASGEGAIVVVGQTALAVGEPEDFPVTNGAYDTSFNGGARDMFVARFDPTLSTLEACTFLGGSGDDYAKHVHVGGSGIVTIGGSTKSSDMPTSPGAFDDTFDAGPDERDYYVARLDRDLTELVYGTYLGGTADEAANALDVESSGTIVLAGFTSSTDFPVTDGAYDTSFHGDWDVFVTRLDPTAVGDAQLVASTFIGGSDGDGANGVVVDQVSGAVTITGSTTSSDYPVTPDAAQTTYGGSGDCLLSRLDRNLGELLYSTFVGGTNFDVGFGVAGDVASRLTVAGVTASTNFPVTDGAYDESWNGDDDVFLVRIDLCRSDVDESGDVGFDDLLAILSAWGPCPADCAADVDGDGIIGFGDLIEVLSNWGACR